MKGVRCVRTGKVTTSVPVDEIVTNEDGTVKHLKLRSGEIVEADEYVSAMPVDVFKRFIPEAWQTMPFFRQADELEGIPVRSLGRRTPRNVLRCFPSVFLDSLS